MRLPALLALLTLAGCDVSTTLDIETPPYQAEVVVRSVLAADGVAEVRLSVSRDPYAVDPAGEGLVARPSRVDGRVVLLRDGVEVETLRASGRTCYRASTATCNAETGQVERSDEDPFECGSYRGAVRLEAGATYTVRAEVPGLAPAEATVTVPDAPTVEATEEAGAGGLRRFRVRLTDPPGRGHRYGLTIHRELDRYTASLCRVGGPVDTLVVLTRPQVYRSDFSTTDPVLVTGAREAGSSIHFVTFPDDAFDGRARDFVLDAAPRGSHSGDTGAVRVQVTAMTAELYDAYQITNFELDENPFAEPADLPLNVVGGYGRVGAVAVREVRFAGPGG
ncbi:DUF4249 family protein [Rubrivirga sp.]|uniref:DUF4249 family protein n=1 Tax=Rubrivirga sp. TaxID=1885344 RepID=UPI003B52C6C4